MVFLHFSQVPMEQRSSLVLHLGRGNKPGSNLTYTLDKARGKGTSTSPTDVMNAATAHGKRYGYKEKTDSEPKAPGHFVAGLSKNPPTIAPATPPNPQQNPKIAYALPELLSSVIDVTAPLATPTAPPNKPCNKRTVKACSIFLHSPKTVHVMEPPSRHTTNTKRHPYLFATVAQRSEVANCVKKKADTIERHQTARLADRSIEYLICRSRTRPPRRQLTHQNL